MTLGRFALAQPFYDDGATGGTPAAPAEPVTTESIVAGSAAGLEGSDTHVAADADGTSDEPAKVEAAPAELDALAVELGLKPGQRDNRIPYSRVSKIVAKAKEEHAAALAEQATKIQTFEAERAAYQQQVAAMRVAEENPEQFLRAIAEADPRYKTLLSKVFEQATGQTPDPSTTAADTGKPAPDVLLADGTLTYSPDGFERLADWKAEQRVKALDARYAERLAPIEQERAAQAHIQAAIPRAQAAIAEARTWPLFGEHEQAIVAAMTADRALSLDAAYRKIVFPKIAAGRDTMRAELLAEIGKKPAAASGIVPGSAPAASSGPRSTEDIVRDAVAASRGR